MEIEIKFKAWDDEHKTMHIPMTLKQIRELLQNSSDERVGVLGLLFIVAFDKLKFLQYTGINDSKGAEIYDGDILKEECPRGYMYKVFRVPGGFAINTHQDDLDKKDIMFYSSLEHLSEMQNAGFVSGCTVIGNIYQNPELIKQS